MMATLRHTRWQRRHAVPATQLVRGELFSCVLFENGGVRCFGGNDYGVLGIGETAEKGNGSGDMAALD